MALDAKLPEVEIKRTDFGTETMEKMAHEIVSEWEQNGPTDFSEMEEKYGTASSSHYGNVMEDFLGPVDHDITVGEIRARYGSVKNYLEERKRDNVDTDTREMTNRELDLFKEGYREGYRDAMQDSQP